MNRTCLILTQLPLVESNSSSGNMDMEVDGQMNAPYIKVMHVKWA